ncbi:unnamed protein product [Effrenium voratum]|nr:unnamed protein product [Effrenium voratum]
MPSRTYIQAMKQAGAMWPCGDHDVCAVQTARKEYMWRSIASQDRPAFQEAAKTGWMVWADNDAVEVLSPDEAAETFKRLRANNEMHKVLTPRYVFTDKHDGLRTPSQPLPLKANARLVVPGFRDPTAYAVRKDAPTASRTACHLVLIITASMQWDLWSADIKSAFLKGELFKPNERELYIGQIKTMSEDEPKLPLGGGGLAKLKKGIFGLSDSPRRWYLRLNKSLTKLGWRRSALDAATWYLWTEDSKTLLGIVIAHVDDLLMGGGKRAKALLDQLGEELGFGSLEHNRFTYCGKFIEKKSDGNIYISMREYHENLKPVAIPLARRRVPDAALTPAEIKQLRALVGSMQWLVANCRFDMGFMLSALQGEKRVVATLMKANQLAKRFKEHVDFALCFKPIGCGLMVVSDASLGNVNQDGGSDGEPLTKLFSQAAYFVLLASKELMNGKKGRFAILDARSHRLPRVCRSTFAAELLGVEEAMDVGHYHRGFVAELNGLRMDSRAVDVSLETVPLTVVTDAKDVYDKNTSDTPSYGSQKSLAFTVAWLRSMLRRPQTTLRWTSTENMFVDAGTKDMELDNLRTVLRSCEWCVTYRPDFVRQTVKKQPKQVQKPAAGSLCVGKPVDLSDEIFSRLLVLSEQPGWHHQDGVGIHVARYAKSYRLPKPRFNPASIFLDRICIHQSDPRLKMEGVMSIGAFLKRSERMLVLWDASYMQRLWCVFEVAAFLKSRSADQEAHLQIVPVHMGSFCLVFGMAGASVYVIVWIVFMHGVVGWEILVLLPIIMTPAGLYAIADARAYMRSVHTLQEQLASFSLRNSRCSCCDWNHVRNGTPVPCDRDAIGHCIGEWFGTEAEFEHAIHSVVLPAFTSRFGEHLVPFRIFLVATVPLFWGMMDLVAGYAISERGREEGGSVSLWWLFAGFGTWLGVLPASCVWILALTRRLRASRGRILNAAVNLLIFALAAPALCFMLGLQIAVRDLADLVLGGDLATHLLPLWAGIGSSLQISIALLSWNFAKLRRLRAKP